MTDIFDEVEKDLRRERLTKLWERYGIYVILAAVLIVVITAGWRGYEAWQTNRERSAGEAYAAVLAEASDARTAGSAQALSDFASDAPGGYAMLAQFRAATTFEQAGQPEEAARILREIADDGDVPSLYRNLASVRAAQVLIDLTDYGAAMELAEPLADDTSNPFNRSARELMGLATYASGDLDAAQEWYANLSEAVGVSANMRQRAERMLALLAEVTPAEADAAAAPSDTEAAPAAGSEALATDAGTAAEGEETN